MKSPALLAKRLLKQWQSPEYRAKRLLDPKVWPISLPIGRPTVSEFSNEPRLVREHVQLWRAVQTGEVKWESVSYRAGGEAVQIPTHWLLRTPAEWVAATADSAAVREHSDLAECLTHAPSAFHNALTRGLRNFPGCSIKEALQAIDLAIQLEPGCALGRPLRSLALAGIDSKFFERHRTLVQQLLDARFDGQVSEQGLESFLGALDENDHWLLVAPLGQGLLPFSRLSVPAAELVLAGLGGSHLLIVENERCLHQLPQLSDTTAVLGSGFNLAWMRTGWVSNKVIGYWGDLDTWGLSMLAVARAHQPGLDALLMDRLTFDTHASLAVVEPLSAGDIPPDALDESERSLYLHLRYAEKGRLEQEFLPPAVVAERLTAWRWHSGGPGTPHARS
ncbi:MAG TPA: Wadjet anti-phage system protein JetD domain-containing protein [Xanthobacteraceae bacterium]|jgi:hypothetical protein|nr:Wadjet anti-phage system protein JetD domain-containing protein [Xanthobacteraceae bacterium]